MTKAVLAVSFVAALLWPHDLHAQVKPVTYDVTGRVNSAIQADDAGLNGAMLHLTVAIASDAAPANVTRDNQHQAALYTTTHSTLVINGAPNPALNGMYAGTIERLETSDTYGGDYCITFGAVFQTPAAPLVIPTLCFKSGSATGTQLPVTGIDNANLTIVKPLMARGSVYSFLDAGVTAHGGAQ